MWERVNSVLLSSGGFGTAVFSHPYVFMLLSSHLMFLLSVSHQLFWGALCSAAHSLLCFLTVMSLSIQLPSCTLQPTGLLCSGWLLGIWHLQHVCPSSQHYKGVNLHGSTVYSSITSVKTWKRVRRKVQHSSLYPTGKDYSWWTSWVSFKPLCSLLTGNYLGKKYLFF